MGRDMGQGLHEARELRGPAVRRSLAEEVGVEPEAPFYVAVRDSARVPGASHVPVRLVAYEESFEVQGLADPSIAAVRSPAWVEGAVLYEIFPRVYGPRGTLV